MQFAEGLSDRQAAEAVRARIVWKYALGLELTDAGFDFSVLSEFRVRLVNGDAESLLLNALLTQCKARGYLKTRGQLELARFGSSSAELILVAKSCGVCHTPAVAATASFAAVCSPRSPVTSRGALPKSWR